MTSYAVYAEDGLRSDFLNNKAIICGINIRNFNSNDKNGNGFIDENEEGGNFLNAIKRLDEIKASGVNVLHVLPITPTGKLKALGTAGSLYAISDFDSINLQIVDLFSDLTPKEQAKLFIDECHKRGIKVILDLPSCGSYDLFLTRPELFLKDKKQFSIVPSDWTDVRLFNAGTNDSLNKDLLNEYKKFVDMTLELGADGIRADVATIKPYKFWEEIINYTREKQPDFLYLAEASDSWREPPSKYADFTPYDKLLEAGFDGYYGSFFNLRDWKSGKELIEHIKFNKKLLSSYDKPKSVIMSFTTHDEVSPVLLNGENYSLMICWLEATLPFNPYFIDGFSTGDDYSYKMENTKAPSSETDDDYYFVHKGKLDIFNFSRKPQGSSDLIKNNYNWAMTFRNDHSDMISKGSFTPLKVDKEKVFAYSRSYKDSTIIVAGNLDYKHFLRHARIKVPGLKKNSKLNSVHGLINYRVRKNRIIADFAPGEIKVLRIDDFGINGSNGANRL